jgi:hypothetical protein
MVHPDKKTAFDYRKNAKCFYLAHSARPSNLSGLCNNFMALFKESVRFGNTLYFLSELI